MHSATMISKLKDADYLDLHMAAAASLARVGQPKWYDARFHRKYQAARLYLQEVRPDAVGTFEQGFAPLRPDPAFAVKEIKGLFDHATRERIAEQMRSIPEAALKCYEKESFGRSILHDHPFFLKLQSDILPLVCDLIGERLVTGYNFLSLYGGHGKCDVHMDEPLSMYTLDYCIDQSADWPIYFSNLVDWPTVDLMREWDPKALIADPNLSFTSNIIAPGDAAVFCGSSQWHYRNPIPDGAFCNLLFFHYYPEGCENLVWPSRWGDHFDIPELGAICDLFGEQPDLD